MLKFFFCRQRSRGDWKRGDDDWSRDPLAHPAIAAMSTRELADLPFVPPPSEGRDCREVAKTSPSAGEATRTGRTIR